MWAKKGKQPLIKSAPTQEKVALSGFINPENGSLKIQEVEHFNYESCMNSIREFVKGIHYPGRKILIVLDNAPWHKKAVRLFREEESLQGVEFLFLPPYSPDFNPIERVWRYTRYKRTHNRYFEKVTVLRETVCGFLRKFTRPNKVLRQLCSNYK